MNKFIYGFFVFIGSILSSVSSAQDTNVNLENMQNSVNQVEESKGNQIEKPFVFSDVMKENTKLLAWHSSHSSHSSHYSGW